MNFSRQIFDLLTVNSVIIIQFTNLFVVRPLKVNSAIKSLLRTNLRHSVLGRMRSAVKIDFLVALKKLYAEWLSVIYSVSGFALSTIWIVIY